MSWEVPLPYEVPQEEDSEKGEGQEKMDKNVEAQVKGGKSKGKGEAINS